MATTVGQSERSITVAVATCGRPVALTRCLRGLANGVRRPDELIVVDQAPSVQARQAVAECAIPGARYVEQARDGLSASRNLALAMASGSIVAVTDDDCVPDSGWIWALGAAFDRDPVPDAVTGPILALGPQPPGAHAIAVRTASPPADHQGRILPWAAGSGANFAALSETLRHYGGWDQRLGAGSGGQAGEDAELLHRILRDGGLVRYEPAAVVRHEWQTWERRLQTRWSYGFGIGALCGLWFRRRDWFTLTMLGSYASEHVRQLAAALVHGDLGRIREHVLALVSVVPGFHYGFAVARPRTSSQRAAYTGSRSVVPTPSGYDRPVPAPGSAGERPIPGPTAGRPDPPFALPTWATGSPADRLAPSPARQRERARLLVGFPLLCVSALIAIEAALVAAGHALAADIAFAAVVVIALNAAAVALGGSTPRGVTTGHALVGLALVALARVLGFGIPLRDWSAALGTLVVGVLVAVTVSWAAPYIGVPLKPLLRWKAPQIQALAVGAGLMLGFVAYRAGAPTLWATGEGASRIVVAVVAAVVAAGTEELLFRGVVQRTLQQSAGRVGLLAASALYAATYLSFSPPLLVMVIALAGLVFSYAVARTGTLTGALAGHSLFALSAGAVWPVLLGRHHEAVLDRAAPTVAVALALVVMTLITVRTVR